MLNVISRVVCRGHRVINTSLLKYHPTGISNNHLWQQSPRCRPLHVCPALHAQRYYCKTHEYVAVDQGHGTVGITDHAQEALGDVVYMDLPERNSDVTAGEAAGTVESVKAASDVNSPVSGTVTEINDQLSDNPKLINDDCYGQGWMFKLKLSDPDELNQLMDEKTYHDYLHSLNED